MTPPSQPSRDDALRAAFERMRGASQPGASPSVPAPVPHLPRRRFWDVRGRMADDLARVPTPNAAAWPRPLAGLIAGLWAALMSWLVFAGVLLIGWVFAPLGSGTFADVMRAAGGIWIVADGGVLHWQGATLSLAPLLASLVIIMMQRRAGTWLASAVDVSAPRTAVLPLLYAVLAAASAQALAVATVMNRTLEVPLWRAIGGSACVACIGFGWGIARTVVITLPPAIAPAVLVVRRFLAAVLGCAVIVVAISAVVHRAAFAQVLHAVAGDSTSVLQVLLLCALYVPTLVLWLGALVVGPGFSLGAGTTVMVFGVHVGALPPIPLLALIPDGLPTSSRLGLVIPALLAVWTTRGALQRSGWRAIAVAIPAASIAAAFFAATATGGMWPGRLGQVGPVWWHVGLATGSWLLFGFGIQAGWARARSRLRDARESTAEDAGKLPT